jgi:GT2 family glycosyltransferase
MTSRMTASVPQTAETPADQLRPVAPRVTVLLTVVEGADLTAALAVLGRQVYDPAPEIVIVGAKGETPEGYLAAPTLEVAIAETDERTDYLWILHSDARPRPDALVALVTEMTRNQASLGGSKLLVAGSRDQLESVGSATDVFGEPYSGLEEGEIDLQQYDVVREVAFVRSASVLVRRDLAQGLGGLDVLLPPIAAGLDFSQRSRLAGGKVISVPSSEVYHQGRCNDGLGGWREQAGRLRAMLTAYRPLTLLWVVPYDFLVSVIDSLANLLLLRWRPAGRHLLSWLWNLGHLPSTLRLRHRLRAVRVAGDEELFRFQARGSVRLREIGSEISTRILSLFDDDQALSRGTRRVWASPGIWGAVLAVLAAGFAARSLIFTGMPDVGLSFPFEAPTVAFERWLAGWNDAGLGSPAPVHPSTAISALASALFFGAEDAARNVSTVALGVIGIAGIGRLGGRYGLRGPGRYLAGLVLMAGPGTAVLAGRGSWTALAAAAFLPWAVRAVMVRPSLETPASIGHYGWAFLLGLPLAALSPALSVVPLLVALAWPKDGARRVLLGVVALSSVVIALPFLIGDPGWLTDYQRRLFASANDYWPLLVGLGALPLFLLDIKWLRVGATGAVLAGLALIALRLPFGGPGVEEALLVTASFGAALVVAAGLDTVSLEPRRVMALVGGLAILGLSVVPFANGRYGLPDGDLTGRLGFADALAGEAGPGRILMASAVRSDIPGEARSGPGFWYRLIDGSGMTSDEVWLPTPLDGDGRLAETLEHIAGGDELRPGRLLAEFSVDWVVLDGPAFRLDEALVAQLDLVPTPLDPDSRVFENQEKRPIADAGEVIWRREGTGFGGEPSLVPVRLGVNHAPGWQPQVGSRDWAVEIDGSEGQARYRGDAIQLAVPLTVLALALGAIISIGLGRAGR